MPSAKVGRVPHPQAPHLYPLVLFAGGKARPLVSGGIFNRGLCMDDHRVDKVPGNELVGPRYELYFMSLQAAIAGLGVALVPEYDLGDDLSSGRLVIPVKHTCPSDRAYYLAHPEQKAESPALAAFRNWLLEQTRPLREAGPRGT